MTNDNTPRKSKGTDAQDSKDLRVYDAHEQGVDQDIREVPPSSQERNTRLARYKDNRQALTQKLNSEHGIEGPFRPKKPDAGASYAVIYLRVSTEEQAKVGGTAEGYSIPYQREACRTKAAAMGLVVVEEYVDAGHSAKSANRPKLKQMLRELAPRGIRYVIVHKIDRLARNKRDDFIINEAIAEAGAALVSVVDLVDDSPQGRFNYTIQAGLAQLYSDNLAVEVMKGLTTKVEAGGTPYRVPVGYLNKRRIEGSADIRWVEIDPDRAQLIAWAFYQYATGDWSISRLRQALNDKGFTTRSTARHPGRTLSVNGLHKILTNPYYAGIVPYMGVYHEGKHDAIIDMTTWLRVQDVLHAHNAAGDKDRTHAHYLKGSIFCGDCGSRLIFSRNKNRHGTAYDYFICMGRHLKRTPCARKAVPVSLIETGVEDFYRTFQVNPRQVAQIQRAIRAELIGQRAEAAVMAAIATKRLRETRDERDLLLKAHYAGAVPLDLLKSEMDRLVRAIAAAEKDLAAASASATHIEGQLERALLLASNCSASYLAASPAIRRIMNQGFFEKLYIAQDGSVGRADLTEPFVLLLAGQTSGTAQVVPGQTADTCDDRTPSAAPPAAQDVPDASWRTRPAVVLAKINNNETPGQTVLSGGSKLITLAEAEGFEPPDGCPSSAFKADAFGRSATLPWGVRVAGQSSGVSASMAPTRSKTLASVACWVSVVRSIMCRRTPSRWVGAASRSLAMPVWVSTA